MFGSMQAPLLFALLAAGVATLGLVAVGRWGWINQASASLLGIAAAGLLLTISFLHLFPEAISRSLDAPVMMAAGFLFGLLLTHAGRALSGAPPLQSGGPDRNEALTSVIAIALHSLLDGMIYSVTFAADFSSGVFASLGLILHEFPEGIIAFAILRQYGMTPGRALAFAFFAAAATTPLGVVLASPMIGVIGLDAVNLGFAASVGLIFYVATGPLLAPLRQLSSRRSLVALLAGVLLGSSLILSPLHERHDHDDHGPARAGSDSPVSH